MFLPFVEHCNGWVKNKYHMLARTIPNKCVDDAPRMYRVAAAVHNMIAPSLTTDASKHEFIIDQYIAREGMYNLMADKIRRENLNLKKVCWKEVTPHSVELENFPRLSIDDILELTLGNYQIKQGVKYCLEMYEFHYHRETSNLLRINIKSRHRTGDYDVWLQHDNTREGSKQILAYSCQCMAGDRMFGICSHITSALWYLGHRRHDPTPFPEPSIGRTIMSAAEFIAAQQPGEVEEDEEEDIYYVRVQVDEDTPNADEFPPLSPVFPEPGSQMPML